MADNLRSLELVQAQKANPDTETMHTTRKYTGQPQEENSAILCIYKARCCLCAVICLRSRSSIAMAQISQSRRLTPIDEIPPHARRKSPSFRNFSSGGDGEWSDASWSIPPLSSPSHSLSRFARSLIGGAHLYSVCLSGMSSAANVM